jgi:uncharacterized ferredoxin-like protein
MLYRPGLFSATFPSQSKGTVDFFVRQANALNDLESIVLVQVKVVRMQVNETTAVGYFRYQAAFLGG